MSINKILKVSAMMAFLLCVSNNGYAKTNTQEAYDNYLSTYKTYQEAVNENKSNSEIQAALKAFTEARNKYQKIVGTTSTKGSESIAIPQSAAPYTVIETSKAQTDNEVNSVGIPTKTPAKPVISQTNDIQRSCEDLYNKLSESDKHVIDELRETSDKSRAKELIKAVESKMANTANKDTVNFMKYEVATALDRLSMDKNKADKYLKELSSSKSTRFVQLAKLNQTWRDAKTKKVNWQKTLAQKNDKLNSTKESFKNTSWLAFPVKIFRGIKSVVSNAQFTSNQGDYEDYMVEYEAIQAKFITNVNAVFDEWQATIDDPEESANIRLVYDNYEAWYARWNLLNSATKTIDVQYFIIMDDAFGSSLLGTLQKKANEGVKVRLMVDTRGSNKISVRTRGYLLELAKNKNIEVKVYNPFTSNILSTFTDLRKMESSNHDKIVIVDGAKCIMGGRNIANTYLVNEEDMEDAWRDCDVIIDSEKICSQLKVAFDEEFTSMKAYDAENKLTDKFSGGYTNKMVAAYNSMSYYLANCKLYNGKSKNNTFNSMVKQVNKELNQYVHMNNYRNFRLMDYCHVVPAHIIDNNSLTGDRKDITENIVKYIDACRTEIYIQNPYFALTDRADAALHRAAARGIPIYIHSNSERSSDSAPTEAVVLRDWKKMLTEMPTMRFFARNKDGQLHGKTFVFDGKVSVIGSYNFDALSEKVNSEVCVAIKSEEFTAELRSNIMQDIEEALEYHLATDTEDEFGPGDVEGAKNKTLTKILSHLGFLQPMF